MIKNIHTRRHISLGLMATGGTLLLFAPEHALVGLLFAGLGILLEVAAVALGHTGKP
jgi:hypothetical protein